MNAKDIIKINIDMGQFISLGYIEDLTDQELLHRPAKGANHINWQLGHLIQSENEMMNVAIPGCMPNLPAGFAEKYTKDTATSDDASEILARVAPLARALALSKHWLEAARYGCDAEQGFGTSKGPVGASIRHDAGGQGRADARETLEGRGVRTVDVDRIGL
jgi:hypothetical protein